MEKLTKIWILTLVLITTKTKCLVSARQCYVCGVGSDAVFRLNSEYEVNGGGGGGKGGSGSDLFFPRPQYPPTTAYSRPPSCLDFDESDSFDESMVRECPEGYQGCLTQINGNEVIRTCDTLALNDCKIANKVTYCYCNGDLCNSRPPSSFPNGDQSNYDASDDDDDQEDVDEDYGDEFSGQRPAPAPIPAVPGSRGTKSSHVESAELPTRRRNNGAPTGDGGDRRQEAPGKGGLHANGHTPLRYPVTIRPATTSDSSTTAGASSLAAFNFVMGSRANGRLLIATVLLCVRFFCAGHVRGR